MKEKKARKVVFASKLSLKLICLKFHNFQPAAMYICKLITLWSLDYKISFSWKIQHKRQKSTIL